MLRVDAGACSPETCGLSRRSFLQIGAAGLTSLGLPGLLRLKEASARGDSPAKDTRVIRAAKEALNGIDPVDVNTSYRFEQGFTMELNLAGVSDALRDGFAGTDKASQR